MKLSLYQYQLKFKFPFSITHGVRTQTDVVYVKLEHESYEAWGEATLPPYLPETQKTVIDFLTKFKRSFSSNTLDDWQDKLNSVTTNLAAKAALDMALWQLKAKLKKTTVSKLLGIDTRASRTSNCFYTIGMGTVEEMKIKINDGLANGFNLFKLKLNGNKLDYKIIQHFKLLNPDGPFAVDMNNGYTNSEDAESFIEYLVSEKCIIIEQPMQKTMLKESQLLNVNFPHLIYADESCQGLNDLEKIKESFGGINIKLMKCGGITEAYKMILKARELNLKVLIGCMSESSVGCSAAGELSPLADWVDLDGPYLISNDPFSGMKVENGKLKLHPLQIRKSLNESEAP